MIVRQRQGTGDLISIPKTLMRLSPQSRHNTVGTAARRTWILSSILWTVSMCTNHSMYHPMRCKLLIIIHDTNLLELRPKKWNQKRNQNFNLLEKFIKIRNRKVSISMRLLLQWISSKWFATCIGLENVSSVRGTWRQPIEDAPRRTSRVKRRNLRKENYSVEVASLRRFLTAFYFRIQQQGSVAFLLFFLWFTEFSVSSSSLASFDPGRGHSSTHHVSYVLLSRAITGLTCV